MLKKEFRDASKLLLECGSLLLIVPVACGFDRFLIHFNWKISEIFNYAWMIVLILYPLLAGTLVFQQEKKDHAFEYLLSLPLSKPRIIFGKIIPRLTFLFVLLGASIVFSPFKDFLMNGFNLIVLFFIAVFLCLSYTSVIVYIVEIGALFWLYYWDSQIINFLLWRPELAENISPNFPSQLLSAALLLIPLGFSFWLTLKSLDLKALKLQMKPYIYIALPAVLILIAFTILFVKKYFLWSHPV